MVTLLVNEQFANWKMTIFKTGKSTNEMGHGFNSVCQITRGGIHLVGPSQKLCSNILKNGKSRRYLKPPTIVIEQSPIKCWIPIQSVFTDHTLAHPLNCRGGVVARLSA